MSSNFANSWQKLTPGNLKQTHLHSPPHLILYVSTRGRRYRKASEGRSIAPWWPWLVARLHRSAGGFYCPFRPGRSISRGRPRRRFHWSLGGRPRDRSTWQWRALCTGTSCCSLATWPKRALRRLLITSEIDGKPVVTAASSFRMNCCQLICSSCLWHFTWKASRALMSVATGVQVSAAYSRTVPCKNWQQFCKHTVQCQIWSIYI